ncbi:MAG: KEOPS complex kinase/ATPase Bud32 [Candidatus Thorarchaeota archaeon]|jgi:TP53 regulating kinase-like protein
MREPWAIGAESIIFKIIQGGNFFLLKHRPKKTYLLSAIDSSLRALRTSRECKMLAVARTLGVPTPAVYALDKTNHALLMDYIEGEQLKNIVDTVSTEVLHEICYKFGGLIALLHQGNVIHGDPTTSNVIVDTKSKLWLVDFGLSEMNATTEMKGVDLHLIQRAFETTHWNYQEIMLKATLEGYKSRMRNDAQIIIDRMSEIRERGRYH